MYLDQFFGTPFLHAGLCWILAALVALGLALSSNRSVLSNSTFPVLVRLGLFGAELVCLAGVFFGVEFLLFLFSKGPASEIISLGSMITTLLIILFYFISWGSFTGVGTFTNVAAFKSFFPNSDQYFAQLMHNTRDVVSGAFFGIIGLLVITLFGIPSLVWFLPSGAIILLCGLVAAMLAICTGFACLGFLLARRFRLADNPKKSLLDYNDDYLSGRDDASGPLMHSLADFRRSLGRWFPPKTDDSTTNTPREFVSKESYAAEADSSESKRWNVLLVIVESLRQDQLMITGGDREVMPTVEALAEQSQVYLNHYAQATHSDYSDMCPLSSHYPLRSYHPHTYPRKPPYSRVMLYDILKQQGYRTAVVSSQNETWGGMLNYMDTGNLDYVFHSKNAEQLLPDGTNIRRHSGKLDDDVTVKEALRWIEETDEDPFFMYMNVQNSHVPYEIPTDFPLRFSAQRPDFPIGINRVPKDRLGEVKDLYSDSLAYVDSRLKILFDGLKKSGEWDRTMVVLTGDTGQAFYEHGFTGHGNVPFEEIVRVPMILKVPEEAPSLYSSLSQHIDIPATVLGRLGLPHHPSFQGLDLATAPESRSVYTVCQTPLSHSYALVRDGFKLIHDVNKQRFVLVNLKEDPAELIDVAEQYPAVLADLSERLTKWSRKQLTYYARPDFYKNGYPPLFDR